MPPIVHRIIYPLLFPDIPLIWTLSGSFTQGLNLCFPIGAREEQLYGCMDWEKRPLRKSFGSSSYFWPTLSQLWEVVGCCLQPSEPSCDSSVRAGLLLFSFSLCEHHSPPCQDSTQPSTFHVPKFCHSFLSCPFLSILLCLCRFIHFFTIILVGRREGAEITGHIYLHVFCLPFPHISPKNNKETISLVLIPVGIFISNLMWVQ